MKIPVDLICIDTTPKANLAVRALDKCLEQASFNSVKLLTNQPLKYAVPIPAINGLEAYSNFVIRELHRYVDSTHCLLVQSDGYVLNGDAWQPSFLNYDYIGAPWLQWNLVGNGGFSLRSRKLLQMLPGFKPSELPHPEDSWLCHRHRGELQSAGIRFAPTNVGSAFAFEGRRYNDRIWSGEARSWNGQFGFHSWLTPIPEGNDKPLVFHHSGDAGDVIYSLAAVKSMGGGVYYFSPDNQFPWPSPTRISKSGQWEQWCAQLCPLLDAQPYIWKTDFTKTMPFSTDVDFNRFRQFYKTRNPDNFVSLFSLHQRPFGVTCPEDEPWLTADPVVIEGRPIVCARSPRFHNDAFPWHPLIQRYADKMVFVGLAGEYKDFEALAFPSKVPWHQTSNMLELARAIAGAMVFVGNQSAPLSIAHGLGKNVIVEEWKPGNPNCHLNRPGARYWEHGPLEIPKEWLI